MRVLAFDLGQNMAAAWPAWPATGHLADDIQVGHCVIPGERRQDRAYPTLQWVESVVSAAVEGGAIDAILYEKPFARGQAATRALWGIAALIETSAGKAGLPCLDITPSEIKQWATGKGKATKEEMIAEAQKRGYTGDNEHEADAFLLCLLGNARMRVTPKKEKMK